MRFIIDFLIFGLIFYAIYVYYPLVFQMLVAAVAKLFDWLRALVDGLIEKIHQPLPTQTRVMLLFSEFRQLFPF